MVFLGEKIALSEDDRSLSEVVQEVTANQEKWGGKAGVTADEVAGIVTTTAEIAKLRAYRPAVAKLLEMINETEALLEDKRETLIRTVAESVDAKAKMVGEELFAKYEHTRA
ncbi:MAG: hypothetical protein ACMG6S_36300, partial [Byssovorax sp.]